MLYEQDQIGTGQAIVIPGEAPETDDEGEDETATTGESLSIEREESNKQKVSRQKSAPSNITAYDSLLQRKLKESQINFDKHVSDYFSKTVDVFSKDVKKISNTIGNAQVAVQDAACNIRSVAEVLFKVEKSFDVIFSCQIMPDLKSNERFPNLYKYRNNVVAS